MNKKILFKGIINAIYLVAIYAIMIAVSNIPAISSFWEISSGDFLDKFANVFSSILYFVIYIMAVKFFYKSFDRYRKRFKTGKKVRCNPFNPFC